MNPEKPFWKHVLRESDGTPSASRLLTAGLVLATIMWVTFLVSRNHSMPDMAPVGIFLSSTAVSLYGVNKMATAASSFSPTTDKDPSKE